MPATIDAGLFTWDRASRSGNVEASSLGWPAGRATPMRFYIKNPKTGVIPRFEKARCEINSEREILWWDYVAVVNGLFVRVRVFND